MWISISLIFLLLVGALVMIALSRQAPRFVQSTAVGVALLSFLLGAWLWRQNPVTFSLFSWSDSGLVVDYAWTIDAISGPVTIWLLLLLVVTSLFISSYPHSVSAHYPTLFLLTAVTLVSVWANSLMGMVVGWFGLLLVWLIALGWVGKRADSKRFVLRVGLLLTAVLLLWLGAASVPDGFAVAGWATRSVTIVLLAAVLQMGIWPFVAWRPTATNLPVSLALWLGLVPVITGAVLLIRLLSVGMAALPTNGLLLTLLGLFGLLYAVRQAWMRLHLPLAVASYMGVALLHLLLLTAVWGHVGAALAMLRLFILGSGVFYLTVGRPLARSVWWRWLPPVVALAAMAGLPLTVGLTGHLALYDGLLLNGRGILWLVLIFLQMPLLTAGMRLFWPKSEADDLLRTRQTMLQDGVLLLLALGLLSWVGGSWNGQWLAWLAIFLVPIGGLILFRFTPEFRQTTAAVRQAFIFRLPIKNASNSVAKLAAGVGEAFREAAAILEGDGNLLWLLALILILVLVR